MPCVTLHFAAELDCILNVSTKDALRKLFEQNVFTVSSTKTVGYTARATLTVSSSN